ncbi:MAG: hypothetical protein AB9835_14225 [Eubacteriales bacterium]
MNYNKKSVSIWFIVHIIIWGCAWGIFESTTGYLLHAVSFGYSWTVWCPTAYFFMQGIYKRTNKASSVVLVGIFSACVKLLDLFLPGRVDRVINPAVSIVFEALFMAAVLLSLKYLSVGTQRNPAMVALKVLTMNTGWRVLYIFYLYFLVPDWIRDISVISSWDSFTTFLVIQNLITSLIIFFLSLTAGLLKLKAGESGIWSRLSVAKSYSRPVGILAAAILLAVNAALVLLL